MGVWGQGGGTDFQGYDYVQTAQPADPKEGETWYDLDADRALVYDGANWVEMTVTDHGQLSGITTDAHRTDSNIISVVDGVIDAETVDGKHASDLSTPASTQSASETSFSWKLVGSNTSTVTGGNGEWTTVTVNVSNPVGFARIEVTGTASQNRLYDTSVSDPSGYVSRNSGQFLYVGGVGDVQLTGRGSHSRDGVTNDITVDLYAYTADGHQHNI